MKYYARSMPAKKSIRPETSIRSLKNDRIFVFVTNWGNPECTKTIEEAILSCLDEPDAADTEQTATPLALHEKLAAGIRKANAEILKGENARNWNSALEVCVVGFDKGFIQWAQAGGPNFFIWNPAGLEPICYSPDGALAFGSQSPLPINAIGLTAEVSISHGLYPRQDQQKYLWLSSSVKFPQLNLNESGELDSAALEIALAKNSQDTASWFCLMTN
jgi:hypothetical protein